jgi:hypothetical protein
LFRHECFDGRIDGVRLYNRYLSAIAIAAFAQQAFRQVGMTPRASGESFMQQLIVIVLMRINSHRPAMTKKS